MSTYDIARASSSQAPKLGLPLSQEALLFAEPVVFAPDHPPPVDEKDPFINVSSACALSALISRGNRANDSTRTMRNNFLIPIPPHLDYV
jgi:hypothetical protein